MKIQKGNGMEWNRGYSLDCGLCICSVCLMLVKFLLSLASKSEFMSDEYYKHTSKDSFIPVDDGCIYFVLKE